MYKRVLHFSIRYEYNFGVRTLLSCDIFELKIPPIGNIIFSYFLQFSYIYSKSSSIIFLNSSKSSSFQRQVIPLCCALYQCCVVIGYALSNPLISAVVIDG